MSDEIQVALQNLADSVEWRDANGKVCWPKLWAAVFQECPCARMDRGERYPEKWKALDGINHAYDLDICRRCYLSAKHGDDCICFRRSEVLVHPWRDFWAEAWDAAFDDGMLINMLTVSTAPPAKYYVAFVGKRQTSASHPCLALIAALKSRLVPSGSGLA